MGIKMTSNVGAMELRLDQIGERAVKGVAGVMRQHAIRIRDLAREYAPVKTGLLEKSIDYAVIKNGRRTSFVVFIDLDALKSTGSEGNTTELGEYAFIMEESLRPYGRKGKPLQLGKRSAEKRASGKKVGGRFLARAIVDGTKDILGDAAREVRRATSSGPSSVGTQFRRQFEGSDE
jgi:hypothetical protein